MFKSLKIIKQFTTKNNTFKNYYKILQISHKASQKQIKSAYKLLAKKYHPDLNQGYEDQFKNINQAYHVLSDSNSKKVYDHQNFYRFQEERKKEYEQNDTIQDQSLEEYRKIQEQYMNKYIKYKEEKPYFRKKNIYDRQQAEEARKYHQAVHFRKYNTARWKKNHEENPEYNQKFDRSKDSLFGFMKEQTKGLWQAWKELKNKK